ncbi:3-oxoadipyl-CoA thiolase [Draconibacterium halophilum]|uniref:Beta-ketoadipyl-CoA thiolase n=1 Tax=Draconibacterium halophilum TaxID=2706887 RepID=A0A6C0RBW4_9BACT|nr:3-oxoadipyl-CoA thiolase [Draconibacterium halophilum]QIA07496.1 3-oxoadipyl-CoA thiolase [Draconibacterium halophilum]
MNEVFICDAIRTPIGRYGGALSSVRADDLAAIPIKTLLERNDQIDPAAFDDVLMGCANQAGEDNRNVARMALLLAGMPESVPGVTVNRLCSSGMEAIGMAARAIKAGEAELMIAGGAENMSRSPLVMPKATQAFSRNAEIYDSTIGWRFVNDKFQEKYGTDPLICTAENLADEFKISREDQDRFAHNSQLKTAEAQQNGALVREIIPVSIPQRKGAPILIEKDEHPRLTSLEKLASLKLVYGEGTTVTAGNASGINDGAAAVIVASEAAVKKFNLTPKAKILGTQAAGVPPRTMGIGPVPATNKLLKRLGMSLDQMDIIELNEAFAAQSLACIREFGMADDDPRLNPLGGAIALGHPLGMSGARLVTTALYQLQNSNSKYALCTMCVGVGQGVSMVLEKV